MMELELIEQSFIQGDYDECLQQVDRRFFVLRNNFHTATGTNGKYMHLCNRSSKCDCIALGSYLLAIAFYNKETSVK